MPADVGLVRMGKNGRLVVPAAFRRELGLEEGGEVLLRLKEGHLELEPRRRVVARAREAVRRYAEGRDLAGELLRERREEAGRE